MFDHDHDTMSLALQLAHLGGLDGANRGKRRRARLCDEFPSVDVVAVLDSSRSFLMRPLITTFGAFSYPFTRRRLTVVQTAPRPAFKCAPCCREQNTSY